MSSEYMGKDDIEGILNKINDYLAKNNKFLSITVYGGSALCLTTTWREATYDIDVKTNDIELLKESLLANNITGDLVNTEIDVFINKVEVLDRYGKDFSNLEVYLAAKPYLLAMKCRALRNKDAEDIINLCEELNITTSTQIEENFRNFYAPILFTTERKEKLRRILNFD